MNISLWILQGVVALMFAMSGFMKLSKSKQDLKIQGKGRMDWVEDISASNIRVIGVLELLAAIGLIVPQVTGILPWLTPLAALGLAFMMVGAMILHLRRADGKQAVSTTIMLLAFSLFVAFGRFV